MKRRHLSRRMAVFVDRYPFLGPSIYMLCVQYLVIQLLAAAEWTHYSWRFNLISDLGNTACGPYADRYVCSPAHPLVNASFVLLGLTMALGSSLIYHEFRKSSGTRLGFTLMGLSGAGTILVGLFPENTISFMHELGAVSGLLVSNISMLILAIKLNGVRPSFRVYTFASALISILAFVLFTTHTYLGLGPGGMERIISYPQNFWLALFGLYMTATRVRARRQKV